MSAVGAGVEPPGLWGSFGAAVRLLVGWSSIAVAVLDLVTELDRLPGREYLLFHAVLLAGGLALISLGGSAAGAGPVGYAAGATVAAAGMVVSALPVDIAACCLSSSAIRHGYPFTFLARAEDTSLAGTGAGWRLDAWHLLTDLLFWGYLGLIVLVLVATTRRATGAPPQHRPVGRP
jgi:hypothetical protein